MAMNYNVESDFYIPRIVNMRSTISLLVLLILTPLFSKAQTQQKCELGIADAPAIRGVKLGMTSEEVLGVLQADLPVRRSPYAYVSANMRSSAYFRDKYDSNDPILRSMFAELPTTETVEKIPVLLLDINFSQIASGTDLGRMQSRPESLKDVVNFQIDLHNGIVVAIYFVFASDLLDHLDDPGRVAKLSEILNLPEKSWVTGPTYHSIYCSGTFSMNSHREKFMPGSRYSLRLADIKDSSRVSSDIEQFLKDQYEERKKKAEAAKQSTSKPN